MTDLIERLHDWYDDIGDAPVEAPLIEESLRRGTRQRRRRHGLAATAIVVCAALIVAAVALQPSRSRRVDVLATAPTTVRPVQPEATVRTFPDLELLRAWLAAQLPRSARDQRLVRAQIARTLSLQDNSALYAVQLTGTTFVCPCGVPLPPKGPALFVEWSPKLHFITNVRAGAPVNMSQYGRVYEFTIGHPSVRAPNGPTCGQPHRLVQTISPVVRLDHDLFDGADVLVPPGSAQPRLSAQAAFDASAAARELSLAPRVKATLAFQNGLPNSLQHGRRLVWVYSAASVALGPSLGWPVCGRANVVVDANTGLELSEIDGPNLG